MLVVVLDAFALEEWFCSRLFLSALDPQRVHELLGVSKLATPYFVAVSIGLVSV